MAIITLNNNSLSSVTALPAGVGGKVLQVVQGIYTLFAQTNSQSFVDTGLSKTITPSSTSNKILAIASMQFRTNAAVSQTIDCDLVRDSSSVRQFNIALSQASNTGSQISFNFLDSPSSTSELTYKIQWRGNAGTGQYIRINGGDDVTSASILTLMEIAG